jgi:hypothetical protein
VEDGLEPSYLTAEIRKIERVLGHEDVISGLRRMEHLEVRSVRDPRAVSESELFTPALGRFMKEDGSCVDAGCSRSHSQPG